MRTSTQFPPLPPLIAITLFAALLAITAQPVNAQSINNHQPLEAHQSAVTLTLAITNATPVVNQPVHVTVTLTNHAVSQTVSSPLYTLRIASEADTPVLLPESTRARHDVDIAPEAGDMAHFTFHPVAGGRITVTAQVTVTVQLSPPEQMKIGWQAQPISLDVPLPSLEASIIYEDAYSTGCMEEIAFDFQIVAGDGWGSYDCAVTPGHSFGTSLSRADSPTAAMATFNSIRGDRALKEFHCRSAYSWSERPDGGPFTYSGHGWTTAWWVNISHAADDTPYGGARGASEGIYRTMEKRGLIGPCTRIYLPISGR